MADQASLFDVLAITQPEGLRYELGFLTEHEENELVQLLQGLPLQEMRYKSYVARRRILSFGGQYDFDANRLETGPTLIPELAPLREKVAAWLNIRPELFTQVLAAEYRLGTPLGWHRDVPDFEDIVGVSLLNEAVMKFRPYPPVKAGRDPIIKLTIAPRSIYLLRGPARWQWQHSVAPVADLRYSITFRTSAGLRPALKKPS